MFNLKNKVSENFSFCTRQLKKAQKVLDFRKKINDPVYLDKATNDISEAISEEMYQRLFIGSTKVLRK